MLGVLREIFHVNCLFTLLLQATFDHFFNLFSPIINFVEVCKALHFRIGLLAELITVVGVLLIEILDSDVVKALLQCLV